MARLGAGQARPAMGTSSLPGPIGNRGPQGSPTVRKWAPIAEDAHKAYPHIASALLLGLIQIESSGNIDEISPAGAFGLTQFMPGTAPKYGVSRNNAHSQIFGAAHYLTDLLKQNNGDIKAALNMYNGALRIGDKPNPYADNVIAAAKLYGYGDAPSPSQLADKALQGIEAGPKAILHWTELFAKFLATLLNPTSWAELASDSFAWFLRLVIKAIYKYVVLPPWHATQKAVNYYTTVEMGDSTKVLITISFWATGWAILFGKIDQKREGQSTFGISPFAPPHQTPLGRTIQTGVNTVKRAKLINPSKVEESTPTTPEPTISEVPITQTRAVSATRRRAVKVTESSTSGTARTYRTSAPGEDKDAIE